MESKKSKFIRIGGCLVRVSQDVYEVYYKMRRQERTLLEKDVRNRLIHYDAWDDGVSAGRDVLPDTFTSATEERVIADMTRDKLYRCLAQLSEEERNLIKAVFFEGRTMSDLSRSLNIPYRTLGYRRDRALSKLRDLMSVDN